MGRKGEGKYRYASHAISMLHACYHTRVDGAGSPTDLPTEERHTRTVYCLLLTGVLLTCLPSVHTCSLADSPGAKRERDVGGGARCGLIERT